jgi:hypothetical protein
MVCPRYNCSRQGQVNICWYPWPWYLGDRTGTFRTGIEEKHPRAGQLARLGALCKPSEGVIYPKSRSLDPSCIMLSNTGGRVAVPLYDF